MSTPREIKVTFKGNLENNSWFTYVSVDEGGHVCEGDCNSMAEAKQFVANVKAGQFGPIVDVTFTSHARHVA